MSFDPREVKNADTTERGDVLMDTVLRSDYDKLLKLCQHWKNQARDLVGGDLHRMWDMEPKDDIYE